MRPILVCVCVFSVGCSGQALNSPTSAHDYRHSKQLPHLPVPATCRSADR